MVAGDFAGGSVENLERPAREVALGKTVQPSAVHKFQTSEALKKYAGCQGRFSTILGVAAAL